MILDSVSRAQEYFRLHRAFKKAFDFLRKKDIACLPDGRYDIAGDAVYAMISRRRGEGKKTALLEAHRKYIDIQVSLAGTDSIGWKSLVDCTDKKKKYDARKDYMLFSDKPETWITLLPGRFVILYPEDCHAPLAGIGDLHKVVIKVAYDHT